MADSLTIYFSDGVADVVILGPIARIDFFVLRPDPARAGRGNSDPSDLQRVPTFTVAMPLEALANSADVLQGVRDKLIENGVLGKRAPNTTMMQRASSPNFKLD